MKSKVSDMGEKTLQKNDVSLYQFISLYVVSTTQLMNITHISDQHKTTLNWLTQKANTVTFASKATCLTWTQHIIAALYILLI